MLPELLQTILFLTQCAAGFGIAGEWSKSERVGVLL